MTRMIDAEKLKNEVKSVFHDTLGLTVVGAVHEIINRQPTLTPSNELTCEGCIYEKKGHENCNYCMRASWLNDYYCHRPPEGEEE